MLGPSAEEWAVVVAEVREAPTPQESPALARLFHLARKTGEQVLRAQRRKLSDAEIADLVAEKFLTELKRLVEANEPRRYFVKAIVNAANDAHRRRKTAEKHEEGVRQESEGDRGRQEEALVESLSMQTCLASHSPRDQRILRAVAEGEPREDIARTFDTSRANVDQIVSRAKKRWKEWQ